MRSSRTATRTATSVAVRVAVRDERIGIPAEEPAPIFERFHHAATIDRDVVGVGLGVSIARRSVEAHGGIFSVDTAPRTGRTFTMSLLRMVHAD